MFKYQKEFLTKKVSGKIAFDLISLFHKYKSLQEVQLPREHLSFLQNFIITKYLKQEVDDDLSVCMDERSPCGLYNWRYKVLSMSHDQWVMLLSPMEKCSINFYHEVAFTAQI